MKQGRMEEEGNQLYRRPQMTGQARDEEGHVLRREEEEYVGRRVMVMKVPRKRRIGRPKRRWLDNIRNDLSEIELSGEEAQDRVQWRRLIRNIDPT